MKSAVHSLYRIQYARLLVIVEILMPEVRKSNASLAQS